MSKQSDRNAILVVLGGLGWPLIYGLATCSIFYVLVLRGPLNIPLIHRYFAAHPVSLFATAMFFVGLAALGIKLLNILGQSLSLHQIRLEGAAESRQSVARAADWQAGLQALPSRHRESYLGMRLHDALKYVDRSGSADGLDEELKYLADLDAARQQDSYALVRIIIWATPMLGFLGTVIGITQALGDLDPQELANSIQTAMEGLLAGLYVAFDTTALALSLSIILMFLQFFVDRLETQLLAAVDSRAAAELAGRFEQLGGHRDPHLSSIQRMCQAVIQSSEQMVQRQAQLWKSTIDATGEHWQQQIQAAADQLQAALSTSLGESLRSHAVHWSQVEQQNLEHWQQRWQQWEQSLSEQGQIMHQQQQELVRQGEIMSRAIQATGDVVKLEESLNRNLHALAGAKHFEDTVMSLAAAIHLLSTRLQSSPADVQRIELGSPESPQSERAA